jgi:hypothetical protein
MFSSREAFENDFCPVRDELLGEMYRANENGLAGGCDCRKLQRTRIDAIRRTRRLKPLRVVPSGAGNARTLALRQSQADHAVDQAAQHPLTGHRRA